MTPHLSDKARSEVENRIGYRFKNRGLLDQAFRRSSFCNEEEKRSGIRHDSNEVLEFCGDSILGASVMTLLLQKYARLSDAGLHSDLDEGDYSTIKSRLSDKSMLSSRMNELGFQSYLFMNRGDREQSIHETPSVKEDLFESIIGAVYLDSGSFDTAMQIVARMLEPEEYLKRKAPAKSAKNRLQEICQARRYSFYYKQLSVEGEENHTRYTVECVVNGNRISVGEGQSKKAAELAAAETACRELLSEEIIEQTGKNPIQALKEWNDRRKKEKAEIVYTVAECGDGSSYHAACLLNNVTVGEGSGKSKAEARRMAADTAIQRLGLTEELL